MDTKFDLSNRLYYLILALVIVSVTYTAINVGFWFFDIGQENQRNVVVSGEGKALVKPDVAIIAIGVKTESKKSDEAVNKNNEKMNTVIKAIKDLGVEDKDIKTSVYNLYPVYDYTEESGRELTGYSLDQQIAVKIRNFEKISSILDKASLNGANNIGNLQIIVDNPEAAKTEARKNAIEQAKQKASEMAKNSGLRLGKIIYVQEDFYGGGPVPYEMSGDEMMAKATSSIAPQIQIGEQEVKATVSLTYLVK